MFCIYILSNRFTNDDELEQAIRVSVTQQSTSNDDEADLDLALQLSLAEVRTEGAEYKYFIKINVK
jgi:hypothetical protein